eukprot:gene10900-7558_t
MLRATAQPLRTIGFYIVLHPWLSHSGLVKVGYSNNVEQRLETASYKTCFTPEWSFFTVFECETELDALILEQSVLYCMASRRVPRRELLYATGEDVRSSAQEIAKTLKINTVTHDSFDGILNPKKKKKTSESNAAETLMAEDKEDIDGGSTSSVAAELKAPSASLEMAGKPDSFTRFNARPNSSDELLAAEPAPVAITPFLSLLDNIVASSSSVVNRRARDTEVSVPLAGNGPEELLYDEVEEDLLAICHMEESYELPSLRDYQLEAVQRLQTELLKTGKAVCQMACRCGKTPVAYEIIKQYLRKEAKWKKKNIKRKTKESPQRPQAPIVIYLVPGLSLLRQTAVKLFQYGLGTMGVRFLLVGSHPEPVWCNPTTSLSMTTDPRTIQEAIQVSTEPVIIISTYHSSALLVQTHKSAALVVFDECHRVCGSANLTPFNTILKLPRSGARLFLTATPTYDTPIKMNDEKLFGGVAYRYYLREGINAGHVNAFAVRIILGENLDNLNPFLFEAMKLANKLLVFCRDVEHAEKLFDALKKESSDPSQDDVEPFECFVAHSRLGGRNVSSTLLKFMAAKRAVLFNIRLFQEGVEIPDLNAVFFATPRYSSRDIIQSICRPLNKLPGKPISYIFLPAVVDHRLPEMHPINLDNFSTLIPFTDALMDEDPSLFEYMIDPQNKTYNFSVVGVRNLPLTSERIQQFVLPAIRRGVRFSSRNSDRLMRASRLPWKYVFTELRRVVEDCNRYPKTNDAWVVGTSSLSMNRFYQFCRKGYRLHEMRQPTYLKIHQVRDLESLPYWRQYGVHGPYPWRECLQTLVRLLEEHGTVPPLDVHKGGYIGLDATPLERLCGFLMGVNQSDAKLYLRLAPQKQKDLDGVCARFNIQWRKERDHRGVVIPSGRPTFITISYNCFKYMFENHHKFPSFQAYLRTNFPGYPTKHARMECMATLERGCTPPRYNPTPTKVPMGPLPLGASLEKETDRRRKVMCRVCRTHVLVEQWEAHLLSVGHQRRIAPLGPQQHRNHQTKTTTKKIINTYPTPNALISPSSPPFFSFRVLLRRYFSLDLLPSTLPALHATHNIKINSAASLCGLLCALRVRMDFFTLVDATDLSQAPAWRVMAELAVCPILFTAIALCFTVLPRLLYPLLPEEEAALSATPSSAPSSVNPPKPTTAAGPVGPLGPPPPSQHAAAPHPTIHRGTLKGGFLLKNNEKKKPNTPERKPHSELQPDDILSSELDSFFDNEELLEDTALPGRTDGWDNITKITAPPCILCDEQGTHYATPLLDQGVNPRGQP